MEVLILETNLSTRKKVQKLVSVFDNHEAIKRWSVDTDDRHNVMRIEVEKGFRLSDAIDLIQEQGFNANELDC